MSFVDLDEKIKKFVIATLNLKKSKKITWRGVSGVKITFAAN